MIVAYLDDSPFVTVEHVAVARGGACAPDRAELAPNDARVLRTLDIALTAAGDLHLAASALGERLRIRPLDAVANRQLSFALRELEDVEGSIQAAQRAIALDPAMLAAHQTLAAVLLGLGDEAGRGRKWPSSGDTRRHVETQWAAGRGCSSRGGKDSRGMNRIAATFSITGAIALVSYQTDIGRMSASTVWTSFLLAAVGGGVVLRAGRLKAHARGDR